MFDVYEIVGIAINYVGCFMFIFAGRFCSFYNIDIVVICNFIRIIWTGLKSSARTSKIT